MENKNNDKIKAALKNTAKGIGIVFHIFLFMIGLAFIAILIFVCVKLWPLFAPLFS